MECPLPSQLKIIIVKKKTLTDLINKGLQLHSTLLTELINHHCSKEQYFYQVNYHYSYEKTSYRVNKQLLTNIHSSYKHSSF
jgi:hypothetical protein